MRRRYPREVYDLRKGFGNGWGYYRGSFVSICTRDFAISVWAVITKRLKELWSSK